MIQAFWINNLTTITCPIFSAPQSTHILYVVSVVGRMYGIILSIVVKKTTEKLVGFKGESESQTLTG